LMILFARSSRHGENNTSKGSLLLCKSGMSLIARSSSNVVSAADLSLDRRVDRGLVSWRTSSALRQPSIATQHRGFAPSGAPLPSLPTAPSSIPYDCQTSQLLDRV